MILEKNISRIHPDEIWMVIDEFPKYAVSNFGRVATIRTQYNTISFRLHKLIPDTTKYYRVRIGNEEISKKILVHRLVMQYFIGPCPKGLEVNHKDGDKLNNHVDNLEYVTRGENIRHAVKMGLINSPCGEKHWKSKFDEEDILEIRRLYATGNYTQKELGKIFDSGQSKIGSIVRREAWKHVK